MDNDLFKLSLVEALNGMKLGIFRGEEYTRALLGRIEKLEPTIQAWAWLDPDRVIAAARRADARAKQGRPEGLLRGIPVGVKDIFATKGIPTELGSPVFAGNRPRESARIVKRLEGSGGIMFGKTVTTELAFLSPSKTRNPWNINHTPGGSSSGSAAAVAAGFVPAAIGSQTNGSTIRPAAFCGVVGFKPTQGILSMEGASTFSHTLDQAGVFTRTVADAALLTRALAGRGRLPLDNQPLPAPPFSLGVFKTPVWDLAEEKTKTHFLQNVDTLRNAGAKVTEVDLPEVFDQARQVIRTIMAAEGAFNLESLRRLHEPELSKILTDFLTEGEKIGAVNYQQALYLRSMMQVELLDILLDFDAAITLPATGEAPAELTQTGNPAFCSLWTLCGVPALTLPTGLSPAGLPLGLQVTAPYGDDNRLLAVAAWIEKIFAFKPLWNQT